MLSFDTNIAVHAANTASPHHAAARSFLQFLATRSGVVVCELVLVELYLKLRNEKIFPRPLTAPQAAAICQGYRSNPNWRVIESAPVMMEVWKQAAVEGFAFRRLIDLRLALTLKWHGVMEFATANTRDFLSAKFQKVWNPLAD